MKLTVVAVGRLKSGPERDLVERYRERAEALGRSLGFSGPDILEIPESRARRDVDRRAEEAALIAARIGRVAVCFDEAGRGLTSEAFARRLESWRDDGGGEVSFVIGGPDGLAASLKDRADLLLSFGAFTLPHQLVRVLALEQLYRGLTILAGHPYHRA